MKVKITIIAAIVSMLALLAYSQIKNNPFTPAEDFPRDALIYVQVADLPAMIKLWNASKFRESYAESDNFASFQNNHLGRKLASRWNEFNTATGFPIDLETAAKMADTRAALAIYDIGKLEFVFIAPVSDELYAATAFVQNRDKFALETLADGTEIYRSDVRADHGRQKQELIFTHLKGRFILTTSQKLLAQTLNNINGAKNKNRLIDEPSMAALSEKITPHSATVWINQTALNDDYYFKRYWLMSDVKDLTSIRAGVFDFEMRDDKYIEQRRFLLDKNVESSLISNRQARELTAYLPENIPFYRLRRAVDKTVGETVKDTVLEGENAQINLSKNDFHYSRYDDYYSNDYENLSENYDEAIDDDDDETTVEKNTDFDFSKVLSAAKPTAILTFTEPKVLPAPLFVEFRRAAVYHLDAPNAFNQAAFESVIERGISQNILVSSSDAKLSWETKSENNITRRELHLPMIGWTIGYATRSNELILTNNSDFLQEILAEKKANSIADSDQPFSELTVVDLTAKETAFEQVFDEFSGNETDGDFFTGNISSLLDSLSDVKRIEIRKRYSRNIFEIESEYIF